MIRSLFLWGLSCLSVSVFAANQIEYRVAFVPDIHFHDIYADFSADGFDGVAIDNTEKNVAIRTMEAQLHSTRLFNENYFALKSTLDDIVARGVKLVALPGDFTDDGQPVHLEGLKAILDDYSRRYGLRFFAIPGNHDPVRPFSVAGGKPDFLGQTGEQVALYSPDHPRCEDDEVVCTDKIRHAGYQEIVDTLGEFGLMPTANLLHWETPFGDSSAAQTTLKHRHYSQCPSDNTHDNCPELPDVSYLAEPVDGLWLLAIDANVYMPEFTDGKWTYQGSGNAGYNRVMSQKPYLIAWIRDVVRRAKKQGKTLVAFSHFPMGEFYDNQTASIKALFGSNSFQLQREPADETQSRLAETGLKLHIGGHMHMNDTSEVTGRANSEGHQAHLVNIQAPSVAAYRPAYKLVTLKGEQARVETVTIDEVAAFNTLFPAYRRELAYLQEHAPERAWSSDILQASSYQSFTRLHLQALAHWRFIPAEWPDEFRSTLSSMTLWTLIADLPGTTQDHADVANIEVLKATTVEEFIAHFYMLRNAGTLALSDIPASTLQAYTFALATLRPWAAQINDCKDNEKARRCQFTLAMTKALALFDGLKQGQPDNCLNVDLSEYTEGSRISACAKREAEEG